MISITKVRYIGSYEIELTFSSGFAAPIDLSDELTGEIFEPLKSIEVFKKVYVNPDTGTIEWLNGADFAPEFLLELAKEQEHLHIA